MEIFGKEYKSWQDYEDKNIDPRLKRASAITSDSMSPSGEKISAGSILSTATYNIKFPNKLSVVIPTPDMTAVYISCAKQMFDDFVSERDKHGLNKPIGRYVQLNDPSSVLNILQPLMMAVITSYTAIEAFCNDAIPDDTDTEFWSTLSFDKSEQFNNKSSVERWASVETKMRYFVNHFYGVDPDPKGCNPIWGSYLKIKKIRNRLIHVNTIDAEGTSSDGKNLWDDLVTLNKKPHILAKDVFDFYLKPIDKDKRPRWYRLYPN